MTNTAYSIYNSMRVLIVADSRGEDLDLHLPHNNVEGIQYMVVPYKSQGLESLARKAVLLSRTIRPDLIFIFGGICNITYRCRVSKQTTLRWPNPRQIYDNYVSVMDTAFYIIRNHPSTAECKIIFSPVVGVEMNRYNDIVSQFPHLQQRNLNDLMIRINRYIIDFTESTGLLTPWLATHCHPSRGRGRYSHVYKILEDGCHYSDTALQQVAREIHDHMVLNINLTSWY